MDRLAYFIARATEEGESIEKLVDEILSERSYLPVAADDDRKVKFAGHRAGPHRYKSGANPSKPYDASKDDDEGDSNDYDMEAGDQED